jgi:hypothetical protein
MQQSLSWQANKSWAGQESPAFYRTRTFITAFTKARYLALSCANPEAFVKDSKNGRFLWVGVVSTSHNPQSGGSPLAGCPRLLIQYIRSYPPYRRPFLHPQPEDAPSRGDRDPLIMRFTNRGYNYLVCPADVFPGCRPQGSPELVVGVYSKGSAQ